jgi:hypothetical protein
MSKKNFDEKARQGCPFGYYAKEAPFIYSLYYPIL